MIHSLLTKKLRSSSEKARLEARRIVKWYENGAKGMPFSGNDSRPTKEEIEKAAIDKYLQDSYRQVKSEGLRGDWPDDRMVSLVAEAERAIIRW